MLFQYEKESKVMNKVLKATFVLMVSLCSLSMASPGKQHIEPKTLLQSEYIHEGFLGGKLVFNVLSKKINNKDKYELRIKMFGGYGQGERIRYSTAFLDQRAVFPVTVKLVETNSKWTTIPGGLRFDFKLFQANRDVIKGKIKLFEVNAKLSDRNKLQFEL